MLWRASLSARFVGVLSVTICKEEGDEQATVAIYSGRPLPPPPPPPPEKQKKCIPVELFSFCFCGIHHFHIVYDTLCLPLNILYKHCFQFLVGLTIVLLEIENNACAKFLGVNKVHYGQCGSWEFRLMICRN